MNWKDELDKKIIPWKGQSSGPKVVQKEISMTSIASSWSYGSISVLISPLKKGRAVHAFQGRVFLPANLLRFSKESYK